ncbi:hypothetical protein, partial [Amycolatopsis sp. lyj-90]|uniref:hypothetical protein n=1 Tax=Amycolatopsis sp. lyj-90 TaxID=2789285 RepID=UPI003978BA88
MTKRTAIFNRKSIPWNSARVATVESAAAVPSLSPDQCLYSVGWVGGGGVSGGLFSGVGVVLCGSGVDVVVPEGWVCRVVV